MSSVAIEDNINEKYANKVREEFYHSLVLAASLCLHGSRLSIIQVIQKVGLGIGFYDLLESSDGLIGHGTGLVNVNGMSMPAYLLPVADDSGT